MCLMSCGNVSSLSLPRSSEKEVAAANRAQRTVLAGILYKCRTGCQWAMLLRAMDQKALSTSTFSPGTNRRHGRDVSYPSC